jgi:hypothetical protein
MALAILLNHRASDGTTHAHEFSSVSILHLAAGRKQIKKTDHFPPRHHRAIIYQRIRSLILPLELDKKRPPRVGRPLAR